jgi:hypothetical protein
VKKGSKTRHSRKLVSYSSYTGSYIYVRTHARTYARRGAGAQERRDAETQGRRDVSTHTKERQIARSLVRSLDNIRFVTQWHTGSRKGTGSQQPATRAHIHTHTPMTPSLSPSLPLSLSPCDWSCEVCGWLVVRTFKCSAGARSFWEVSLGARGS